MSNLILVLSQAAGQLQIEAFTDTLYSHPKMSSSVHQKALYSSKTANKFAKDYAIKKASVMCDALDDYFNTIDQVHSSSTILFWATKFGMHFRVHAAHARVSRNLNIHSN